MSKPKSPSGVLCVMVGLLALAGCALDTEPTGSLESSAEYVECENSYTEAEFEALYGELPEGDDDPGIWGRWPIGTLPPAPPPDYYCIALDTGACQGRCPVDQHGRPGSCGRHYRGPGVGCHCAYYGRVSGIIEQ